MGNTGVLRVGIDASCLAGHRGLARYLAQMLPALATQPGMEIAVFTPEDPHPQWRLPLAVTDAIRPWRSRCLPWLNLRVPLMAAAHRVDVTWFPANETTFIGATPHVLTVHDVAQLHFPERFFASVAGRKRFERRLARSVARATHVVTDSRFSATDLAGLTGCDPAKIAVVPIAAGAAIYPPSTDEIASARRAFGIAGPYILFVGGFDFRKNLGSLIQAFRAVVDQGYEHALVLVGRSGRGEMLYPPLGPMILEAGLADRCIVLDGTVGNDDDLRALYGGADLFVFPSVFEGFGLPPLEAMACGTPVVCSTAASLPEVVGDAAVVFDPHEIDAISGAILTALADDELRASLAKRGLDWAKAFSWDAAALQLRELFETCYNG